MRYIVDHDLHIHSWISPCAGGDKRQSTDFILKTALENGYSKICLTDHFWDEKVPGAEKCCYRKQTFAHLCEALPLPQHEKVQFFFGCEAEMDMHDQIAITGETIDRFDFVIIPTTHLHFEGLTIDPSDRSIERRAARWVERFDALLNMELPFYKMGIAHLTTALIVPPEETRQKRQESLIKCLDLISDDEFAGLFTRAAKCGLGIEINLDPYCYEEAQLEGILRPYRIAKKCGCKFYFGSDAHVPEEFVGTKERAEKLVELLNLEETDKFLLTANEPGQGLRS